MTVRFCLLLLLLIAAPATSIVAQQPAAKHAILIGVNDYDDPSIKDLAFCETDVEALQAAFSDPDTCGFQARDVVALHTGRQPFQQPTRMNILAQIRAIPGRVDAADTVVVFFSGHGVLLDGESYLLPSDCQVQNLAASAVALSELVDVFAACPAKHKMLVLDCCHAGAQGKQIVVQGAGGLTQPGAELLARPFGKLDKVVTLASCKEQEQSYESLQFKRGYFTHHLVSGLQNGFADLDNNDWITSTELAAYLEGTVNADVRRDHNASQTPVLVVNRAGVVPSIPLARATFQPYTLPLAGQQDGLPPEGCQGSLLVQQNRLEPDLTNVGRHGRGLASGEYILDLPPLGVRKSFVLTMGFRLFPNDDNSAIVVLHPIGRKPWRLDVRSRGGSLVNDRVVAADRNYLNRGQNTLTLTRRVSDRGTTISVVVNGQQLDSNSIPSDSIPLIQLGLYHGGRLTSIPAITNFEVRPLKP